MILEGLLCLTLAIYHEARSEPIEDQVAVAAIVMNRVEDKDFPNSVCGVVYQTGAFSWTKSKKKRNIRESSIKNEIELKAFTKAKTIATLYLKGTLKNPIGDRKYFSKAQSFRTEYKPIKLTRKSKHVYY